MREVILYTTVLVLVILGGAAAPPEVPSEASPGTPEEIGRALDDYLRSAVDNGFSGVVLVARNGEVLFHQGYGMANREAGIPNTTDTLFDIGSISKQFTKAAIVKLEEQGKLSTSDPISRFLDDVPEDKDAITLDQVIDHTAGFHEYHDTQGDFEPMDRTEALRRILAQKLRFEPGTQQAYSNSGYTLLAAIVQSASGEPLQSYVKKNLLEPAGMKQTGWYRDPDWEEQQVAIGYDSRTLGTVNSPYHWPEISWAMLGNGGMVSSAAELFRWIQALRAGKVLSEAGVRKFYRLEGEPKRLIAYAGGSEFGFISVVLEYLERDDYLIVTTNADGSTNAEREFRTLAKLAFGEQFEGRKEKQKQKQVAIVGPGLCDSNNWGLPTSSTGCRAAALLDAIKAGTREAAREFIERDMHPSWLEDRSMDELLEVLAQIQTELADPVLGGARKTGAQQAELVVRSGETGKALRIHLGLDHAAPHLIVGLDVTPEEG